MIQRKQTLFLLLSVLLFAATYYFPFGQFNGNTLHNYQTLAGDGTAVSGIQNYYFSIALSVAALITLISIFLYSNRPRQMAILRLSFIFFAAGFALLAMYIMNAGEAFAGTTFEFGVSFFLPFAALFLNLLALRAIRKDENKVRSMDRIR